MKKPFIIFFLLVVLLSACNLPQREDSSICGRKRLVSDMLQKTDGSQWSRWVEGLSGKRTVKINDQDSTITSRFSWAMFGGQKNAQAFDYVLSQVSAWVSPEQIEVVPFTTNGVSSANPWKNLVVTFPGTSAPQDTIYLTAHLDSIIVHDGDPMQIAPGADDNGSGSAALLEAIRILRSYQYSKTIKVVFFTGEEEFEIGSNQFVANYPLGNPVVDINLDMIGYNATNNGVFQIEAGNSPSTKIITDCLSSVNQAYRLNLAPQIINQNASDRSDHVSFWKKNIPAVWIFDGFDSNGNVIYPFYHRPSDQLANLNPDYASRINRLSVAAVASLATTIKECPREEVNLLVKTTPTQAILNWDPVASAVSYHILRSLTGCSFDWRSMAVVNVTNWKDTSVQNGTNYYYRVEANFGPQASRCVSVSQSCIQARP